jgi:hypothetical protein
VTEEDEKAIKKLEQTEEEEEESEDELVQEIRH